MKTSSVGTMMAAALLMLGFAGCSHLPGKPGFRPETLRPDQELGFVFLYKNNCSGCHGDSGLNGAALPLDNPVYLGWAGREHLIQIVTNGVPQSSMLAFGRSGGGLLTGEQVEHILDGMIAHWGKPGVLNNADPPGYAPVSKGDAVQGKVAFQTYCARCHGADGKGTSPGVRHIEGDQFQVFAINCAHMECPAHWFPASKLFMCPCHGGVYYENGAVAAGPPPRGLYEYKYKVVGNQLMIWAGELPTLSTEESIARPGRSPCQG